MSACGVIESESYNIISLLPYTDDSKLDNKAKKLSALRSTSS